MGNWRQYCILKEDETLSDFLLDTIVFNKKHLFKFLDDHKHLMIRSCFGYECIYIFSLNEEDFEVTTNEVKATVNGKSELFDYLKQFILKNQQYMIQQLNPEDRRSMKVNESLVTIHREIDSKDWNIVGIVPYHENSKLEPLDHPRFNEICIRVGNKFGANDPLCQNIVIQIEHDESGNFWIRNTEPQFSSSKWNQYHALKSKPSIHSFLIDTELATPSSLFEYLSRYKQVILKPAIGQWGKGVIGVTMTENNSYEVHIRKKKTYYQSKADLLHFLKNQYLDHKRYIIQKKINLAKIDSDPFDVRIMVQKGALDSPWRVTGRLTKVASKDFIITNVAKSILPLEEGLERSKVTGNETSEFIERIDQICLVATNHLSRTHIDLYKVGYDIGITESGEAFIIEVNFKPDVSMFYLLKDKTMHKTIMQSIRGFRDSR